MATRKPAAKKAVPVKKAAPAAKKTVVRRTAGRPRKVAAVEAPAYEKPDIAAEPAQATATDTNVVNDGYALANALLTALEKSMVEETHFIDLGDAPIHVRALFLHNLADKGYLFNGEEEPGTKLHHLHFCFFQILPANKIVRSLETTYEKEGNVRKLLSVEIDASFDFAEATPKTPYEQEINGSKYLRVS